MAEIEVRATATAHCVTCGDELHPERAEKYDYCTRRACREENARPLTIAAVAVNKAADQYLVLDERARRDLAAGRYQDQRKSSSVTDGPRHVRARAPVAGPRTTRRAPARQRPRRAWTRAQEELALVYSDGGMRPDEIAERLGMSRYTVTQLLLSARDRAERPPRD
jgi:DNA-binding CsgD family transcriptional regulator